MHDWGKILVSTRLEKNVSARFFQVWTELIKRGLRPGDGFYAVAGKVAHKAQNDVVRAFLDTECESLLTLDSDADVAPEFLEQFRTYEPGFAYDILQAFYPRRGWPPRAIWMKRNALGEMMECFVTDPDAIQDVDLVGTHAALFRREVFIKMLGDHDPATFEWFFYPRHREDSEDGAFSIEAQAAGFRLGATSAVRAGHLSEILTTWDSYQEYLSLTGRTPLIHRYSDLARQVGEFTGEEAELVVAKAVSGSKNVRAAWDSQPPTTPAQERAFYGQAGNGYLYDLINWNCQPLYERILTPLKTISGQRVLVVGAGLGTEAEVMAERNTVDVFELPGTLKDFAMRRLGTRVNWLHGATLKEALDHDDEYDLIVAVDTLEHIHPDELGEVLAAMGRVLARKGSLYAHNNWAEQDKYPMHHDHRAAFDAWCAATGLKKQGENLWTRN